MKSTEQLLRIPYISTVDKQEREYFLYLPDGYKNGPEKKWPVMLFLHGNGERGNGKDELDFVLAHGPLYEAWIHKKDLPFIIISPQLHMFGMDKRGIDYIDNRTREQIPRRLEQGVPARSAPQTAVGRMSGVAEIENIQNLAPLLPEGWDKTETDLMGMIDHVLANYRADTKRVYLTGLSYGGFGAWYLASRYPEKFAAISPVAGWGHPDLMDTIAEHKLPVWVFAGGRDTVVPVQYFYAGLNKLERLGHNSVRFTVHEDMPHDVWRRVYRGDDLYNWLLEHSLHN